MRPQALLPFAILMLSLVPVLRAQPGPDDVFKYLSRDHPGLAAVWTAFDRGDAPTARRELLRYFQTRTDRLGTELYAAGKGNGELARRNARNEFSWKGTSRSFGATIDWKALGTDREWNYSLNRMLWFENLAEVYRETHDETLARAWKDQILSWISLGEPGFPRTIDTGRRMEGLASSYCVFVTQLQSPSVDAEANAVLLASIYEQCEFLYNPDHWRRYSNWGTFESSGLARAVLLFPEFKRSDIWLREMFFRMQVQICLSYDRDGMHVELSPSYHTGELQVWVEFSMLADRNGVKNPWLTQNSQPAPDSLFSAPAQALAYLMMPSGKFPRTGDTDDSDGTAFLRRIGLYLDSPPLKYVGTGGREGSPPPESSKAFPAAGLYVLRSGWGEAMRPFGDQIYLLFDATVNFPWHAHRDAFNLLLSANGRDLLVDAGRFTYNDGPDRNLFLSAASHNTVVIDGIDQTKFDMKPESSWKFSGSFDYVWGSRLQGAVTHRRTVCFVKPEYVVVVDRVAGAGRHRYRQFWHLDPSVIEQVTLKGSSAVSPGLLLSTTAHGFELGTAPVSFAYRERTEGPLVTCSWEATGESTVATLLLPTRGDVQAGVKDVTPPGVRTSYSVLEIEPGRGRDLILVRNPLAAPSVTVEVSGVETDAELLFLRRERGGSSPRISAFGCSSLKIDGRVYRDDPGRKADLSMN